MDGFYGNMNDYIDATFKPNEIFHNGNAWSFDYKELQVDFITCADEDYDSNYHYLAFNDLGNFLGRLAQSIGFKSGQEGLWYNYFSDANTKTKIMVSKDYPKIFQFLGLDYQKWLDGFDTLEDIFEYTMTSSLFNPEMFQLSQLNKINRERNLKRASYMAFLDYIEDKPAHPEYNENVVKYAKNNIIEVIRSWFPEANIDIRLAEIEYKAAKKKLVNMKFNGKTVMERYGLQGKELGEAIYTFKDYVCTVYYGNDFDDIIVDSDVEYIYALFEQANNIK